MQAIANTGVGLVPSYCPPFSVCGPNHLRKSNVLSLVVLLAFWFRALAGLSNLICRAKDVGSGLAVLSFKHICQAYIFVPIGGGISIRQLYWYVKGFGHTYLYSFRWGIKARRANKLLQLTHLRSAYFVLKSVAQNSTATVGS